MGEAGLLIHVPGLNELGVGGIFKFLFLALGSWHLELLVPQVPYLTLPCTSVVPINFPATFYILYLPHSLPSLPLRSSF